MIDFDAPPINAVIEILLRGLKINTLSEIKPRVLKSDDEKFLRTRRNAEVFSPSHVVKFMVDALDAKSQFWQCRIDSRWLEIACGEAPFITNRYDAETGEDIPINQRVGILDRKLRAIPAEFDKIFWAKRAVQSVYGYDIQSDSLLIARANVLLTFAEFTENFSGSDLAEVADVIAKNFWLMDALNIPSAQGSLFDAPNFDCKITDWLTGEDYFFGGNSMKKFDFVIGNPPYQDETSGDNKSYAPPVYNILMEQAHKVGEKVALITPARFLFDAGGTPKDFNKKMLSDPHLKVLDYAPKADKYFKGVEIKGGVVITLRDETKNYGAIGIFTPFPELNSIHQKVCIDNENFQSLSKIMRGQMTYKLSTKAYEDFPDLMKRLPNRTDTALRTNAFEVMPDIFLKEKPDDGDEYFKMLGKVGAERVYRFVRCDYMENIPEFETYKVFVPKSNGSGALGEVLSTPLVGATQTFISVGAFDTRTEAEACLAYIRSKFCRVMLGILKITQDNPPATWAKVPLQDFTAASDINWTLPISEIDKQLYKKYGLDDAEINFIETHVKAMA